MDSEITFCYIGSNWKWSKAEVSKHAPNDILPPARLHVLIVP